MSSTETLPFSETKQLALLGHGIRNPQFLTTARLRITPEAFLDAYAGKIWRVLCDFRDKFGRSPLSQEEFREEEAFEAMPDADKARVDAILISSAQKAAQYGLDGLQAQATEWLQAQLLRQFVSRVVETHNLAEGMKDPAQSHRKMAEAFDLLRQAVRQIDEANFDPAQTMSWDDIEDGKFLQYRQVELEGAMTFGLPLFDEVLNVNAIDGNSLLVGDHTTILAPSNVGKTTTIISVLAHNILMGRRCAFVHHEGRPQDLKNRIVQCILGRTESQMRGMLGTPDGLQLFAAVAQALRRYLVMVPMLKPGTTIEDLDAVVRRETEKSRVDTGRGFDLVADDYPAKLGMKGTERWQRREREQGVYEWCTNLALELEFHWLDAIQTNRTGSKVNRGTMGEGRNVGMEDVNETWGAMTTATNVLVAKRSDEDKAANMMSWIIDKSRNGDVGWCVTTRTDFGCARTHGFGMPATRYRVGESMDIQALLKQQEAAE